MSAVAMKTHEPYVPSPLAQPRPLETPARLKVGRFHLVRDEFGQLCVFDGVRGTHPAEHEVELMLEAILENRWRKHVA